jgi:lambda family phage tail tape measure protein
VAKQVEDIVVRLVGEGFEALDKIKGSFRELGKVTNLAEKDILSARDSLSEFAKAAGNTEAVNKGLIDAFKGLRSQVDVNSAAYRSFSTDIARLETELRGSTAAIDRQRTSLLSNAAAGKENVASLQRQVNALRQLQQETRPGSSAFLQLGKDIDTVTVKLGKLKSEAQAFNLALGQQAGATPEVLNRQIATLQKGLQSVRFDAEQFVETLRKIQLLQITQTGRTGRAGVIADFDAYRSREFTGGYAAPSRLAAMPDTTAALNQELGELTKRLDNVSRGGTDYVAVSLRIADIQRQLRTELVGTTEAFRQLDIAQTGADRRAGKLADIQEYYRTQGPTAPGVGGFRDPQTGAMIAAGSRLQTDIRPGTQYDQPIGPQPLNPAFAAFESNIKQTQDRITSIYDDAYVRRTQLQADYNQISIDKLLTGLDMEGQVRNAAFGRELADFDKQLEARDRRRGRRLTGSQLAQGAGAALSGGIFGGPEGLIGGLGGLAVGGVGGAFAGAAAGAQVGMFRQQLGGTADYAASIGKLQIALRGVVGSQEAYDAAIRAAAAATRDLNIPQEEATRGLTRLSAAVIGAGGTVADSSFAFRAMSEAIKATGGNAEQVDGALLALTQVFSKGKVSAEELNQIAERLPGTFTLFAQAAGKTGPELQKALEQGQVGLNDLMKFLALTGERYGATALEIAGSSQDAGARLTVAFQAMRLEVGKALQPLGAELQGAFAKFIEDITPDVVSSAKAIAEVLKFFTTNEVAGGLAKFALELTAVGLAIKGLQAAAAGLTALNLASWFTGAATGIKITGDAAAVAAPKVGLLKATLSGFIGLVSKPIVVTIVIASVIEAIKRISAANSAFADFLKLAKQPIAPDAWLKSVGGDALSTDKLKQFATEASKVLKFNTSEIDRLKKARATVTMQQLYAEDNVQQSILNTQLVTIDTQITNAEKRVKESQAKLDALNRQINAPRQAATTIGTNFPGPAGEDKDKAGEKAARDAAAAAAEQQRLNESLAKARIALDDEVFRNAMELVRKKYEYEQELEGKRRNLLVLSQTGAARGTAELVASYFENMQTLTNRLANAGDVVKTATQGLKSATALAETTVSTFAAAGGGAIANILPGTRGGPNINEGVGYGRGRLHAGQDLGLDIGDPIHARRAGTVMQAYPSGFGRVGGAVVVRYDDGTQGTYGHTTPSVRAGSAVAAGQRIATVAPDGSNTHLHYELRDALGKLINPINALTASLKVPAGARQATGVAAATRRDVAAEGGAATAAQGVAQAKALQALEEKQVKDLIALGNEEFVLKYTDALRQQNAALADAATVTELRNRLQLAGERPETIEAEVRKTEETMRARQETEFLTKAIETLTGKGPAAEESANAFRAALAAQNVELANTKTKLDEAAAAQIAFNEAMRTRQDDRIGLGMQEGVTSYIESIGTMRKATEELTVNGIKGVENAIFDLVTTGKTNFREFAADILRQTARMIIQQLVLGTIMRAIGGITGFSSGGAFGGGAADPLGAGGAFWNAKGNAFTGKGVAAYAMGGTFAKNNIVPFAMGGAFTNSIVTKPTLFKFANGGTTRTGLMGEAGPEAIMPLSRGPNGKLGVASSGSGTTNVTVNVDASGSKAQGDSGKSEQLGRAVSQAVQDELLKQKRPGGLLA